MFQLIEVRQNTAWVPRLIIWCVTSTIADWTGQIKTVRITRYSYENETINSKQVPVLWRLIQGVRTCENCEARTGGSEVFPSLAISPAILREHSVSFYPEFRIRKLLNLSGFVRHKNWSGSFLFPRKGVEIEQTEKKLAKLNFNTKFSLLKFNFITKHSF